MKAVNHAIDFCRHHLLQRQLLHARPEPSRASAVAVYDDDLRRMSRPWTFAGKVAD
jgi:hypothetical protein